MEEKYDLEALAEAMLLDGARLPETVTDHLQVLQRMLETAVPTPESMTNDRVPPQVPGYGKTACPAADGVQKGENGDAPLCLRDDETTPFDGNLIGLSARRDGAYVTVPRVVG